MKKSSGILQAKAKIDTYDIRGVMRTRGFSLGSEFETLAKARKLVAKLRENNAPLDVVAFMTIQL